MRIVIDINPSKEGIEQHWEKFPNLKEADHSIEEADPYIQCLIRETTAALEMEGIVTEEVTVVEVVD